MQQRLQRWCFALRDFRTMKISRLEVHWLAPYLLAADIGFVVFIFREVFRHRHGFSPLAFHGLPLDGFLVASLVVISAFAMGLYQRKYMRLTKLPLRIALSIVPALVFLAAINRPGVGEPRMIVLAGAMWLVGLLGNRIVVATVAGVSWFKRGVATLGPHAEMTLVHKIESVVRPSRFKVLGDLDHLARAMNSPARFDGLDEIVVSDALAVQYPQQLLSYRLAGIDAIPLSRFIEKEGRFIDVNSAEAMQILLSPARNWLSRTIKRCFDVVTSLFLLIFTLPVSVPAALAICLSDGGSIFYAQERVGQGGRTFKLLKLRTMRVDAEADGVARWAAVNDPRITPIGRFLRRSRIDEIPQLINVLRGQMSLVGPRPERAAMLDYICERAPMFRCRLLVPPGITGWAQVNLPYGADLQQNIEKGGYDLYYVKHSSLILDLIILIQTVRVILFLEGSR